MKYKIIAFLLVLVMITSFAAEAQAAESTQKNTSWEKLAEESNYSKYRWDFGEEDFNIIDAHLQTTAKSGWAGNDKIIFSLYDEGGHLLSVYQACDPSWRDIGTLHRSTYFFNYPMDVSYMTVRLESGVDSYPKLNMNKSSITPKFESKYSKTEIIDEDEGSTIEEKHNVKCYVPRADTYDINKWIYRSELFVSSDLPILTSWSPHRAAAELRIGRKFVAKAKRADIALRFGYEGGPSHMKIAPFGDNAYAYSINVVAGDNTHTVRYASLEMDPLRTIISGVIDIGLLPLKGIIPIYISALKMCFEGALEYAGEETSKYARCWVKEIELSGISLAIDKGNFVGISLHTRAETNNYLFGLLRTLTCIDFYQQPDDQSAYKLPPIFGEAGLWLFDGLIYYEPAELPKVDICAKSKGVEREKFFVGEMITFEAEAFQGHPPYEYVFHSDLVDEPLGSGVANEYETFQVSTRRLRSGHHKITVEVTDQIGAVGDKSIPITVHPTCPQLEEKVSAKHIKLSWKISSNDPNLENVDHYQVHVATDPKFTVACSPASYLTLVKTLKGTSTSLATRMFLPDTEYYFKLGVKSKDGPVSESKEAYHIRTPILLNPPTEIKKHQVVFSFIHNKDTTPKMIRVRRRKEGESDWKVANLSYDENTSEVIKDGKRTGYYETSVRVKGLEADKVYKFKVRREGGVDSNIISAKTKKNKPPVITAFKLVINGEEIDVTEPLNAVKIYGQTHPDGTWKSSTTIKFKMDAKDEDGNIKNVKIDFEGDGSYVGMPHDGTWFMLHSYSKPGTYVAKVRAIDNDDAEDSKEVIIEALSYPYVYIPSINDWPGELGSRGPIAISTNAIDLVPITSVDFYVKVHWTEFEKKVVQEIALPEEEKIGIGKGDYNISPPEKLRREETQGKLRREEKVKYEKVKKERTYYIGSDYDPKDGWSIKWDSSEVFKEILSRIKGEENYRNALIAFYDELATGLDAKAIAEATNSHGLSSKSRPKGVVIKAPLPDLTISPALIWVRTQRVGKQWIKKPTKNEKQLVNKLKISFEKKVRKEEVRFDIQKGKPGVSVWITNVGKDSAKFGWFVGKVRQGEEWPPGRGILTPEELKAKYNGFRVRFYYKGELPPKGGLPPSGFIIPPFIIPPVTTWKVEDAEEPELKLFHEVQITKDLKPGETVQVFAPLTEHIIKNRYPIYVKIDPKLKFTETKLVQTVPGGLEFEKRKVTRIFGNIIPEENEDSNRFVKYWPKLEDVRKSAWEEVAGGYSRFDELFSKHPKAQKIAREISSKLENAVETKRYESPREFIKLNKGLIESELKLAEELKAFVDEPTLKEYLESLKSLNASIKEIAPKERLEESELDLVVKLNGLSIVLDKLIASEITAIKYDQNGNGYIDKEEAIKAVNDYLVLEEIDKGLAIEAVNAYLLGTKISS